MSKHCHGCSPVTFIKYAGNCSDPCDPCGQKTPTSCVQYGGEDLDCLNAPKGTTLDVILKNINDLMCQLQECCSTTTTSTSSTSSTSTTTTTSTSTTTTTTTQCPCSEYAFSGTKTLTSAEFTFVPCGEIIPITVAPGDTIVQYCVNDSQPIIQVGDGFYEKLNCCSTTTTTTTQCPCTTFNFYQDPILGNEGFVFVECGGGIVEIANIGPDPVSYCVDRTQPMITWGDGSFVDTNICCEPAPTTTTTTTTEVVTCESYFIIPDGSPASWTGIDCYTNEPVGGVIPPESLGVSTNCIFSNSLVLVNAVVQGSPVDCTTTTTTTTAAP